MIVPKYGWVILVDLPYNILKARDSKVSWRSSEMYRTRQEARRNRKSIYDRVVKVTFGRSGK